MSLCLYGHPISFYLISFSLLILINSSDGRVNWKWNTNHTLNMDDICKDTKRPVIRLSNSGSMSYGYLIQNKQPLLGQVIHSANCSVLLRASPGHGVTVAFRRIDTDPLCFNYVQVLNGDTEDILSNPICGTEYDKLEQNYVYSSESSSVRIVSVVTSMMDSPGFELTFTSFSYGEFELCQSSTLFLCHNRKCIFKHLLCDTHNNCGDLSDELDNGICNEQPVTSSSFGAGSYVGIVVSLLILVLIFLFIVVPRPASHRLTWLRSFRRRRILRRNNSLEPGCHRPRSRSVPRNSTPSAMGVATVSVSVPIRYLPSDRNRGQVREPPPHYTNLAFDENPPTYEEALKTRAGVTRRSRSQ